MTIEDLKQHWQDETEQAERIGKWCWTCDKAAVDRCVEGKHNFVQPGTTPLEVAERRVGELEGALKETLAELKAQCEAVDWWCGSEDCWQCGTNAKLINRADAALAGKVVG